MTSLILSLMFSFVPPEGTWTFLGQHQITSVREYQFSLMDLSDQGYQCLKKEHNIFQCSKAVQVSGHPELTRKLNDLKNTFIKIYSPADVPELILNTEYLKQYRVEQKVILQKPDEEEFLYFPEIEYGVYKNHLKVYLHGAGDTLIFEKENTQNFLSVHKNFDVGTSEKFTRFSVVLFWQGRQ